METANIREEAVIEKDRRRFHRIKYPDDRRPKIIIKGKDFGGVDISERGISLTGEDVAGLQDRSRIEAQITFSDGETLDIEGEVSRVTGNHAAIYLPKGIPLSRIKKELELLRD